MRLFDIGAYTYINLDYVLYVDAVNKELELVNGDKIHLADCLFDSLIKELGVKVR